MLRSGEREIICLSLHCHHQNDLRWAAVRAIFMFHINDKVTRQCPQTTAFEEKGEASLSRGPSAYQRNSLPLGQTSSLLSPSPALPFHAVLTPLPHTGVSVVGWSGTWWTSWTFAAAGFVDPVASTGPTPTLSTRKVSSAWSRSSMSTGKIIRWYRVKELDLMGVSAFKFCVCEHVFLFCFFFSRCERVFCPWLSSFEQSNTA